MLRTKDLFLSFGLVLLLAVPPALADLVVGKSDGTTYSIPACDTEAQMMDVVSQGSLAGVRARLTHYNGILVDGEPVCGRVIAEVVVTRVILTRKVEGVTVTVFEFTYDRGDKLAKVYGVTDQAIKSGQSV